MDEVKHLLEKNKKENAERTKREAVVILTICKDIEVGTTIFEPAIYARLYNIAEERAEYLIREILKIKQVKFNENPPYFGYRQKLNFEILEKP